MTAVGGMSEQQVLAVGRSLLTELARLHESGRVSGAVGPGTVLVDDQGVVHLVEGPPDQAYASPEVLTGQPATERSDLYSAGALLAHLFRGRPTLPPTAADLDRGIAWLLGPVLEVDPAVRPGSAAAMVGAIDQLAEQRHGPDWRRAAALAGLTGAAGSVPVVVLASGGSAAATGVAGAAGAAGVASAAGGVGGAGSAGSAVATGAAGGVGGQVAAGGGAAASQAGAAGAGQGVVSAGGAQAAGHGGAHAVGGGITKSLVLKVGAAVTAGSVGVAGAAVAFVVLTGGETRNVDVPATANIYLIGADDETTAQLTDPGTDPEAVDVEGAGTVSFPSVEGEVGACDGCELEPPDGGNISFASTGITAFNGIAGVVHADRTLFVVGVFVGDDQPTQPDTAVVDLTDADEDLEQEPDLGEPFFIGDGETGEGEPQEVVVPDGATTLYLGFADAYGFAGSPGAYGDNDGSVDVEVAVD
ncbi:hypothetical protein [Nocardioides antri]|uniref:Protein kinase domain-containing protein n=1 Tax=Nocardioides antri TaxID=2607659 RepID=A0A5B1LXM1_9ACTN|nr:hypothetical protein [Nocardioides antri]KAA1425725.1 hypothetical protein F0U47_18260 [Nocardioides antri]